MIHARWPASLVLSARRPEDVARLHQHIVDFFQRDVVEGDIVVPYDRQAMRGEIFSDAEVLGESYGEEGVTFKVRASAAVIDRLRANTTRG